MATWAHLAGQEAAANPNADPKPIFAKWQAAAQAQHPEQDAAFKQSINQDLTAGQRALEYTTEGLTGLAQAGNAPLGLFFPETVAQINQVAQENNPNIPSFGNTVARGVGAAVPMIATAASGAGTPGMAAVGGIQSAGETRAAGGTLGETLESGITGAAEAAATGKVLGAAGNVASKVANPVGRAATAAGIDVLGNAALGAGTQAAGNVARGQPVGQGVGEAATVGGITGAAFAPMSAGHATATRQNSRVNEVLQAPAQVVESPGGSAARAMHEVAMAATGKAPVWYQSESPRAAFLDPTDGRMYVNVDQPQLALHEAGHALFRGDLKPRVQSFIADHPDTIEQAAQNKASQAESLGDSDYAQKVRSDKSLAEDEGFAKTLEAGMTPQAIADLAKSNPSAFMRAYERVLGLVDRIGGGNRATGRLVERQLKQFIEPLRANLDVAKAAIEAERQVHIADQIGREEAALDAGESVAGEKPQQIEQPQKQAQHQPNLPGPTSLKQDLADIAGENAEAQRARDEQLRQQGDEAQRARELHEYRREDADARHRLETVGAVPLAATHAQPVAKTVQRPAGFGRGELEEHFSKLGHGVDVEDLADRIAREQDAHGDPFSFPDKLPTEVRHYLEGRPEARRLFRVATTAAEKMNAVGPDSMNHEDYFTLAELLAGSKLKAGIESARRGDDNDRFLAHLYSNQALAADVKGNTGEKNLNKRAVTRTRGSEARDQIALDASDLHPGHAWEIEGLPARVTEGPDGERLLQYDGKEYDLAQLDKVPVDKGTFAFEEFPGVAAQRHTPEEVRAAGAPYDLIRRLQENLNAPHQRKQPGSDQPEHPGDGGGGASAETERGNRAEAGGQSKAGGAEEVDDIPFGHAAPKAKAAQAKPAEPETEEAKTEPAKPLLARIASGAKLLYNHLSDKLSIDPLKPMRRVSPEAETAGKVHASAKIFAPAEMARLTAEAAPQDYKNPQAMNKARRIMNLDNVLGGHDEMVKAAERLASESQAAASDRALSADLARQSQSARESADAIEKSWRDRGQSLEEVKKEVLAAKDDPQTVRIIEGYKRVIEPEMNRYFNEMKAVDPNIPREGRGLIFGARVNLVTKADQARWEKAMGDPDAAMPSSHSASYRNPAAKKDRFDRRATFTGDYSDDWNYGLLAALGPRINETSKLKFYDALEKGGIAVRPDKLPEGVEPPETIGGQDVRRLPIEVPETGQDGSTRMVRKTLLVRQDMVRPIRDTLGTDQPGTQGPIAKALNAAQLAQASDAITHFKNQTATVARAMGAGSLWKDAVRKFPMLGTADAVKRMYDVAQEVIDDGPGIRKEYAELAKEGNARAEYPSGKIPIMNKVGDLLHLSDKATRILLSRFHKDLVARGEAKDTPQSRYDFINQIGQYNTRLMGPVMRMMKQKGWAPFVVAGRNITAGSIKAITGNPGYHPVDAAAWRRSRAMWAVGLGMAGVTTALLNLSTTGQVGGRSGTPLGAWDLGTDEEDGKHKTIDLLQLSGIRRGLRATGLDATIEGLRQGKDANQIVGQGIEDVGQSALHPWIGPALSFGAKALTGRQLDMRGRMEAQQIPGGGAMQYIENARAALESQNPFLYAIARPGFKAAGLDQKPADEDSSYLGGVLGTVAKSANAAVGLKDVKPGQDAAETMAERLAQAKMGSGSPSPDDAAKYALHRKLVSALKADPDAGKQAIEKAVEGGELSEREAANISRKAGMSPLAWNLKSLGAADAAKVYESASDEEKDAIREEVVDKVSKSPELSAAKQDELLSNLGIEPPADLAFQREYHRLNQRASAYAKARKAAQAGDRAARSKLGSLRLSGAEQSRLSRLRNISAAIKKARTAGESGKVKRLAMAAA